MSSQRGTFPQLLRSPALWAIAALFVLAGFLWNWLAGVAPSSFFDQYGYAAVGITLPAHVVLAMTPFPSDLIAIANGAIYGLVLGAALSYAGWWIAALLQFGLGRRARQDFHLESRTDQLPDWLRRLPIDHPLYLIGVRQIPWLGMHVASFVPGAAGVEFTRFLWCSAIGAIPGSILMTAIGAGLVQLW